MPWTLLCPLIIWTCKKKRSALVDSVSNTDREGYKERQKKELEGGGGLLPSSLVTCPLEHGTMQYSSRAREPAMQSNRQDSPQRCSSFFPSQSAPHQRSLVSALADRSVSVKLCSDYQNLIWAGLLANPPTHSKSKCAIKNAHLSSSSRLPNAYASYLRDRVKWYCKRYGISFIRYTIQISSGGGCWGFFFLPLLCKHADWTLGECETDTALVERHPSGCRLDSHLHTLTDSLFPSPAKCEISSDVLRERERNMMQHRKFTVLPINLGTKSRPGINTDVNC